MEQNKEMNFMGVDNFKLSALARMEMVWSSAILGEPQYYREAKAALPTQMNQQCLFTDSVGKSSGEIFMSSLHDALSEDFEAVLKFAVRLRKEGYMRLGPQIILVEAALHPARHAFNEKYPIVFRQTAQQIIQLPTDIYSQLEHYCKKKLGKSQLPGILKRCWKDSLEKLSPYQGSKYIHKAHIVDLIRICHPSSKKNDLIKQMVENGKIPRTDEEITWEVLRSQKHTWTQIVETLGSRFPHMALLRNLRNIAGEVSGTNLASILEQLEKGVLSGKQLPFRYYTAYQQFSGANQGLTKSSLKPPKKGASSWEWKKYRIAKQKFEDVQATCLPENYKLVQNSLEKCMIIALNALPKIEGKVVSLCDNSGSAWGAFSSTYGSQTVATIGNLSGLLAALKATKGGEVGVFGDRLHMYTVTKDRGILEQLEEINKLGKDVGQSTENGIWLWFKHAFENNEKSNHVDHLFIYSDMQAGHGGLYGSSASDYNGFQIREYYIDVIKLIERHRIAINSKLNVFTVQTAGYDNALIPEVLPRTAIMAGWTGNEISYACTMVKIWDQAEASAKSKGLCIIS
jgi:hypothetical protein